MEVLCRKGVYYKLPEPYYPIVNSWGFKDLKLVTNYLREKGPKYILLQYVPYAFSKVGIPFQLVFYLLIFRLLGIKIHTNFHEISIRLWEGGFVGSIRALGQRATAYLISLVSNSIQTSSSFYGSLVYPFKPDILPIPSNFEFIYKSKNFQAKSTSKKGYIILTNANRCTHFFFEVISELFKVNADFKLLIIGRATGLDFSFIETQLDAFKLSHRSQLLVNLSAEDYTKEFNQGDIYFQLEPVDKKGKGGVSSKSGALATALMIGLPTITTKGDLTDDQLLIDKTNVVFVPFLNTKLIVTVIESLIEKGELYKAIKKNGKELYANNFAWAKSTEYIKSIITE